MSSNLSALFDAVMRCPRKQSSTPVQRRVVRPKRLRLESYAQQVRDREDALQRACDERWDRIERAVEEVR